jgi:MFS transporter, CP family, cyanate transporter
VAGVTSTDSLDLTRSTPPDNPAAPEHAAAPADAGATAPPTAGAARATTASVVLLLIGFVLVSLNSRVAFGQIGPLAPLVGWDRTLVTVLGLIPPLVMGLSAPLAPLVRARLGEERGLLAASAVVLVACVVRMLELPGLVIGTVVASVGIAVINVLVPVLVKRRFPPGRIGVLLGVYALAMGGGSAVGVALTVPALHAAGGSWPLAIGVAVVPAALALLGMIAPAVRAPKPAPAASAERTARAEHEAERNRHVARTAVGWSLLAFFGLVTLLFYATLAWLPSILIAAGESSAQAGTAQTVFIVGIALGGFSAPAIAGRMRDQRAVVVALFAIAAVAYLGLLLAPTSASLVWSVLLGIGVGSGQGLAGVLYAKRGRDHSHTAALSAFSQTFGYLLAALGPVLASVLAGATGGWTAPLIALLALAVAAAVLSLRGASARHDAAA